MKLSIIVVSYNEYQYLSEALDSCLSQKGDFNFEIIIGDDGSTDGSIEMIQDYAQKYPHIIQYFVMDRTDAINIIPSIRVSDILKKGFEMSRGIYLCVLSGDDVFGDKRKNLLQLQFLDSNPEYSSCYTDYYKFWNDGKVQECKLKASLSPECFWATQYMHISSFIFKRESIKYLLNRFCDDTGLIFSILISGKSKHISIMGMGYRQRELSIMNKADDLELNILELALMQDALNAGGLYRSTLARFYRPLKYIIAHREELREDKYRKYFINCAKYSNNILKDILEYDYKKEYLKKLLCKAEMNKKVYTLVSKIEILINMIIRR